MVGKVTDTGSGPREEARSAIRDLPMPVVYLQHLAREFPDLTRLLVGTDLSPGDLGPQAGTISVRDNLRCVANAMSLASTPDWYQGWGARIAEHFHGPFTLAWLSAPSLGAGLDAFAAYFPHRIPYMDIRAYSHGEEYVIEFLPLVEVGDLLPLLIEVPMLILQRYVDTIRNASMSEACIEVTYPAPAWRASYASVFEPPVRFDQTHNRLLLPLEWREVVNLGYDEAAWHSARRKCDDVAGGSSPRDTLTRVRSEIFVTFERVDDRTRVPTLERTADSLHLSRRTLIRRLRALGTTFHQELDDVRKILALELLERGRQVGEIAELLGYSDPGNFAKAFRRWFGVPPSRFRDGRASAGHATSP